MKFILAIILVVIILATLGTLKYRLSTKNVKLTSKKDIYIIGPEVATEEEHRNQGVGPGTRYPKEICFRMLASDTGKMEGYIYKDELMTSGDDDTWLLGEVNGMKAELRYNPKDIDHYSINISNLPPSQYS